MQNQWINYLLLTAILFLLFFIVYITVADHFELMRISQALESWEVVP